MAESISEAYRRAYFASVNEGWHNLPEELTKKYPSPQHLRKSLLIEGGYCSEDITVCGSEREAMMVVSFMKSMHAYDVVVLSGNVIKRYSALSQNAKMDKELFQKSSQYVRDSIAAMVGITAKDLDRNAK